LFKWRGGARIIPSAVKEKNKEKMVTMTETFTVNHRTGRYKILKKRPYCKGGKLRATTTEDYLC